MNKSLALQMLVALTLVSSSNALVLAKGGASDCTEKSCAAKTSSLPFIDRKDLKSELSNVKLVNALDEKYFERSHVKGSINIPTGSVEKLAPELLADKDAKIVVYCMNTKCHASDAVGGELSKLGYKNVRIYREGLQDMISNGFDVEGTNPKEPMMPKTASK
jgi:rhodanese-related sulfurtransferase